MKLTVTDVSIIARTAKSTKERTRTEAYKLVQLCDQRLAAAGRGELQLDAAVRLDVPAIVRLIWVARKTALAQWKAAKAAETAAAAEQFADEVDALLHEQRMAEAYALAETDPVE